MSDHFSHPSSAVQGMHQDDFEEDSEYDGSSIATQESELSPARLATHPEYAVLWELLHAFQEAAFSDIPDRYQDCLSIFDTSHSGSNSEPVALQRCNDDEGYEELLRVAGATATCSDPWSLPAVMRHISKDDAILPPNIRVLSVAQVAPTAAIYLTLDTTLAHMAIEAASSSAATGGPEVDSASSASPLVHPRGALFASTVFTSASQISRPGEMPSFHALHRYNRLATTSLLRQTHSFHIDAPVFGVLLRGSLVAIHIDWYEERDGVVESNSAFYRTDDDTPDIKTWDLRQPAEAHEVTVILSNLRNYTSTTYASRVRKGLESINGPISPWKWAASRLPEYLTYTRCHEDPEELIEDKVERWHESIEASVDDDPMAWIRGKLDTGKLGHGVGRGLPRQSHDFLSPPSTPQSPGDLP